MEVPDGPNQRWSLDFVSDAFTDGRRFRILTVVDDFTKENVALVPDTSISGLRVTRELDQAITERGMPKTIVSDNGTEFTSMVILKWVQDNGIDWHYIQPHSQAYKYALPCKGKNPRKTHLSKASTAGLGMNVSMKHCSAH